MIDGRIPCARNTLSLIQTALAERLGIERTAVRHWEKNKTCPDRARAAEPAAILQVNAEWLLTAAGPREPEKEIETAPR